MNSNQSPSWPGWETVKLIGRGSFGEVYEIQRDIFGDIEKAALKVISIPKNASDIDELYSEGYDEESVTSAFKSHLKSIVAEYSLMRKMNGSANIVNCDDVRYVQHDDGIGWDIFIKMELLTPLTKALTSPVSEEMVIRIAKDMCKALELCKRYDIIHRDIKPQNIFVSPNGDYKLGDFGIAKAVEKTMGGTKIGTYRYMAPEVYHSQPYGSAADIYSLGLVLYWLLNELRMPFLPLPPTKLSLGKDEEARHRRLAGEVLPAPAHGSEELKRIVLKACAYNVEDRYSSASEMLEDLDQLNGLVHTKADKPQVHEEKSKEEIVAYDAQDEETIGLFAYSSGKTERNPDSLFEEDESDVTQLAMDITECATDYTGGETLDPPACVTAIQSVQHEVPTYDSESVRKQAPVVNKSNQRKTMIPILAGIIVAAVLIAVAYFNMHVWVDATCTEASVCKICGKPRGESLGHQWKNATCTTPKHCSACGLIDGAVPFGHNWVTIENNPVRMATFRTISVPFADSSENGRMEALKKAERIYEEWFFGAGTEEYFVELENQFNNEIGEMEFGLFENILNGQLEGNINNWCFDPMRKPGEGGIVESTNAYIVIYYVTGGEFYIESENPRQCKTCGKINGNTRKIWDSGKD